MKFLLTSSVFTICLVISVFGQNTSDKTNACTDEVAERITSRGIKIGSKIDDVLNSFASDEKEKQQIRNSASGPKRTHIGYEFFGAAPKSGDERFKGVSNYIFEFLDGRIVSFGASYDKPRWKDVSQFGDKIIDFFNLPKIENWKVNGERQINIRCENYDIHLIVNNDKDIARSGFRVTDTRISQILEKREQIFEDEQRQKDIKVFKP